MPRKFTDRGKLEFQVWRRSSRGNPYRYDDMFGTITVFKNKFGHGYKFIWMMARDGHDERKMISPEFDSERAAQIGADQYFNVLEQKIAEGTLEYAG